VEHFLVTFGRQLVYPIGRLRGFPVPVLVTCSECGGSIPPDAPEGICPACLWRLTSLPELLTSLPELPSLESLAGGINKSDDESLSLGTTVNLGSTIDFVRFASSATPPEAPVAGKPSDVPGATGRRLGNYDLLEELGRGGMGVVYKAVPRLAGRTVAVKLVLGGAASGADDRRRFLAEVQSMARLRHPHIVPIHEIGEEEGCSYFSMEYMPGGTLSDKVRRGPVPVAEAARIIEHLAAAVQAAHEAGVLHRDIKPGNVMFDGDGTPKLTDFGLCKQLDQGDGHTRTGAVVGTAAYMPPEQAGGTRELTATADVYSLGATLYAVLTGRAPFIGRDFQQTIHRVLNDDPVPPRALRGEIPRDLEAVCLKALEKDAARRYPTAQALGEDLARWREGASTLARPQSWPQRIARRLRRHWRAVTLATVLLVTVSIAAALWPRPEPDRLAPVDAALKRGEMVMLIGKTGPPKWHRWLAVTGTVSDGQAPGHFQVFAVGNAFLELAPRIHQRNYRISAEFLVDESTDVDSLAGIYIARVSSAESPAGHATRLISCALTDNLLTNKPAFSDGDPFNVQDSLIVRTQDKPLRVRPVPMGELWVKEPVSAARPWRQIVAEVRPDGIRVRLQQAPGQGLQDTNPSHIPTANFERQTARHQKSLAKDAVDLNPAGLEYDPTAGCGLYVRNARVFFRNVSVEPLP
jgi:serine/threonine-protein kinase